MNAPIDTTQFGVFACMLGEELRRARQQRGWTRKQLLAHLESDISLQTVATYESGTRQCSVARLIELCHALEIHAHDLLARVHQRARLDVVGHLALDLDRVVHDTQPELMPLHRWARQRLATIQRNQPHAVPLDLAALESMAKLCDMTTVELVNRLRRLDSASPTNASAATTTSVSVGNS